MIEFQHLFAEAAPWLHQYGYLAVGLGVLFEGMGVPLPGSIFMSGAALLAGRGEMNLLAVMLTAWLAAMLGDNLGYWIGRSGGRRLLLRAGLNRRRLKRFEGFFRRFGVWLILFGRFFDGTRQLDGLVAGSARMPWGRYFMADVAGSALWVGTWCIGLYTIDRHPAALHRFLIQINPWVAAFALLALVVAVFLLFRRGGDRMAIPRSSRITQPTPDKRFAADAAGADPGWDPSRR